MPLKEINWQKTNRNNNLHTTNNEDIIQHDSLKQCKIEEFHPNDQEGQQGGSKISIRGGMTYFTDNHY